MRATGRRAPLSRSGSAPGGSGQGWRSWIVPDRRLNDAPIALRPTNRPDDAGGFCHRVRLAWSFRKPGRAGYTSGWRSGHVAGAGYFVLVLAVADGQQVVSTAANRTDRPGGGRHGGYRRRAALAGSGLRLRWIICGGRVGWRSRRDGGGGWPARRAGSTSSRSAGAARRAAASGAAEGAAAQRSPAIPCHRAGLATVLTVMFATGRQSHARRARNPIIHS